MILFFNSELTFFEIIEKLATITIAAGTLFFSYIIYRYQIKKDDNNLRLDWYKTIIIESKFEDFFTFFSNLNNSLNPLSEKKLISLEERGIINSDILDHFSQLENNFISLLLAVDIMLYHCVKQQFDDLVDGITLKLSDDSIDWNSSEVYKEEFQNHISLYKTKILKLFVEFRGLSDSHQKRF